MAKKLVFAILSLLLISIPQIIAENYYADITVQVDDAGFVTIEGKTNNPSLLAEDSQKYTSKTGDYWVLNISNTDIFSDYVYTILLPEQSSINYIRSSSNFRIEQNEGKLAVKGFGQNESIAITVQYQIGKVNVSDFSRIILIIFSLAVLAAALFLVSRFIKKRKKSDDHKTKKEEFNMTGLSSRQKSIVKVILQENKPITQSKIQSLLKLPKASVSRNIHSLELKGIIEKERTGMSNIIKLKK